MSKRKGEDQGKKSKHKYLIGKINRIKAPSFVMNPAELHEYLPQDTRFSIKRVYWLTEPTGDKKSGQHAHLKEEEVFILIRGNTEIVLDDTGKGRKNIKLDTNSIVWIPRLVWHGFENLSSDCVLLALSSTNYNPNREDYVEDYQDFKKRVKR